MDKVYIRGLEVQTVIGIYDWERKAPQTLIIDLEMAWSIAEAAASDNIDAALNYKSVSQRVIAHVEASRCLLIETLAEELATLVREEFGVPWLCLELSKPGAVGEARTVGVKIERGEAA
ncbi:dihydroneopterin aldolase [Marinobacterium sp. YM272]|uniref:dihydroneopterin aldolase n=1 Tax=Marinobacterium sp. YM272 TaxID=3421654 RepID=UPI003D7F9D22